MSELYGLRNGPLYQEITHDGGNIQIEEIVGILNGNVNSAERKLKKIKQLEKENAAQKKQLKELAEAAEVMLELLVDNAPIDGLWLSNIDEWDCLIKEAQK